MSNENTVRIMRAISAEYYHKVPSELELLTVTPEQNAISNICRRSIQTEPQ